ncbi:hypothetical protein QOZ80_1AG0032400 [Eleusine coracana subsp. coracana]|nr:hypothetical protein QOZ80_1AG0032400 [Eleusine coracana subsp. coracana]
MAVEIQGTYRNGHYVVWFEEHVIETTVTASGAVAASLVRETRQLHRDGLVVGLDVEWRPARVPGPVAVLQLCADHRCLVFKILHADYVPADLARFLADPRFTFAGVGVHADAAKLQDGYGLQVGSAADLRHLAADAMGRPDLRGAGLKALVWEVMGVPMEKPHQVCVSAWDARRLTYDQLKYACADAFASYEVGRMLYDGEY